MLSRIALLTDGITPYVTGGMQRHSFFLTKYFAQKGIEVFLYHTPGNKEFDIEALDVFSTEEKEYIHSKVIPWPDVGKAPGHYLRENIIYSQIICREMVWDVDFIYAQGFAGWYMIKEKQRGKKMPPIGVNFHGLEMFQKFSDFKNKLKSYQFRKPVKYNSLNADVVFSFGGKILEINRKIGVSDDRMIVLPLGIENEWVPSNLPGKSGRRKLLFVGRYERRKGIEELSSALKSLLTELDFEMHFVGPIPRNLQIDHENVVYHGKISDMEEIKKIYADMDVLVCPSYSEGMPNVIVEAMSHKVAVIASDVGAINQIVSGKSGWLIEPGNINKLSDVMRTVIKMDQSVLLGKQEGAQEVVRESLIWDDVIESLIKEINLFLGKKHVTS